MRKILIVDDEAKIREVIREYLQFKDFVTDEAADGMEAVEKARKNDYDLIIMDIMMPRLDGFSACKEIRKTKDIPVIMLSARGEEYDKLFGFALGIDDYVVKPFSPKELMARVEAVLLRTGAPKTATQRYEFDGLVIDIQGRSVTVDGKRIPMTPKEYELLLYMATNKNIALSREKLLSEVWNYDYFGEDRTVDTHIKMLRGSLGSYRKFIVTMRGLGYKFEYPPSN